MKGSFAPPRHLLDVDDLSAAELVRVLDLADAPSPPPVLAGRSVALIFEKPSLRTRNATEVAVMQLGGHPVSMHGDEVGLGRREPVADVARALSLYHAAVCARVFDHEVLVSLAGAAGVPVINLLSDFAHPCQAVADLLTLRRHFGPLEGLRVAYVGDFNNVARSLAVAGAMAGVAVAVACPDGFGPTQADLDRLDGLGGRLEVSHDPKAAAAGADAVYTDVWVSMGHEAAGPDRRRAFAGFTVDAAVMGAAAAHAVFLHCLPAHRGE
ncbi:MAG: ornithine carbamoyltransferase, partial [Acidimicrobiales bacterium]